MKKLRVFSIVNNKGGVGKTTSVVNIAAALAKMGKKVLVIDFDPQANATSTILGRSHIKAEESIAKILENDIEDIEFQLGNFIKIYERGEICFHIIPGHVELFVIADKLMAENGREYFLNRLIKKISEYQYYDYVLIDSQPSLGVLVSNVLCASSENELILCLRADSFSRDSIDIIFRAIKSLGKNLGIKPKNYQFLITQYDARQGSDCANVEELTKSFLNKILPIVVKNTTISKAHDLSCDVFSLDHLCEGAKCYWEVTEKLIEGEKND